ncbi:MAG: peptide deformylase [Bifidobacteriaceae bacterium]|nr:peptide deformylase [Bifidobacteriaceae bacterium]
MEQPIVTDTEFLSRKSRPATKDDAQVITDLRDTLEAHKDTCVGLAANMIGSLTRVIIVATANGPLVMVNPVITKRRGIYTVDEACLSLDGTHRATRFDIITVKWQDENFAYHTTQFSDYTAEIIEHEVDHLEGKLI